jgi:tRNA threonylcarbamoyladenosine biosynthesis protein TsaB
LITLALDTATPAPSLAVLRDGAAVAERVLDPAQGAGRRVAEEIHRLLSQIGIGVRDLDEIVVGVGPGGFTGLRIGIATALGLGQALGIPVRGVASIEALAAGMLAYVPDGAIVVPVIDAKRQEVFAAAYRGDGAGGFQTVIDPHATSAAGLGERLDEIATPASPVYLAGDGIHRCADVLGSAVLALPDGSPAHQVSAVRLAQRAGTGGARPVSPLYLRLPDAEVNRIRRAREAARSL